MIKYPQRLKTDVLILTKNKLRLILVIYIK